MKSKEKRLSYLKKMLQIENSLKISEISERLGVSPMTTRRDIDILAHQGVVKVLHGAVVYNSNNYTGGLSDYMLNVAENQNVNKKKEIGRRAVTFVEENDILFIDAGSTTESFANYLPTDFPFTVVCYSINIFLAVAGHKNINIILAGGTYNRTTTILEQPKISEMLLNNRTKKAFISAGGFHSKLGLTCTHQSECQVKKTAISSSVESFLLIDSSKFGSVHSCFFAKPEAFNHIITNNDVSGDYKKLLHEQTFAVHYV
jgi:DeoR family transcriptional regulator, deoxyribose operon repressor